MASAGAIGFKARVPTALVLSLVMHVGGLAVFLYVAGGKSKVKETRIDGVELMIERKALVRQVRRRVRRRRAAPSMKDFLKMALPSRPRSLPTMRVKVPERNRLMDIPKPKLNDRGRLKTKTDLKLELGRSRPKMAKLTGQPLVGRRSRALQALPKLAEVGARRAAPKVLAMAKLQEARERDRPVTQLTDLSPALSRRRAPRAAALLQEAVPAKTSALGRLASMLPEKREALNLEPERVRRVEKPLKKFTAKTAALPVRKRPAGLREVAEEKKAMEIEGPLSSRKIVEFSAPPFPRWARELGLVEADVAIKFFVDPFGNVIEDRMRVERTSGYGRLDRLAMKHLKRWRFEALPLGARNEWGIITFRFVLE